MELSFFKTIYGWFIIYSDGLYNYLAGYNCQMDSTGNNLFDGSIGWWTLGIVSIFIVLFYRVRHTSFSGLLHWLITMGSVAVISWFIGWGITRGKDNDIPDCHRYGISVDQVANVTTDDNIESVEDGGEDEYLDSDETTTEELSAGETEGMEDNFSIGDIPVITESSYIAFGFSNMIVAILEFILLSFIFKRFSKDCRHTPWLSKWPKH